MPHYVAYIRETKLSVGKHKVVPDARGHKNLFDSFDSPQALEESDLLAVIDW
jgi:hypothetical protein